MKKYIFIAITCLFICSAASLKNSGDMQIEISGLKNNSGNIKLSMFNSESGYPEDGGRAFKIAKAEIKDKKAIIVFRDIPYGKYAIAFFHDENDNDKIDFHFFGMPKEAYGASNDAKGFMGPPSFEDAAFSFDQNNTRVIMKARN